jgi:dynein heavy chain
MGVNSQIFQRIIEGMVEKRPGRGFGPPGGKKCAVFIDDLNLPEINTWGDQITNEIVRQQIEAGGMYSLERPGDFKFMIDLWFVAAMNQPVGGKNDIPNRLKRHFCVLNVTMPSLAAIDDIYGSLVRGRFSARHFDASVLGVADKLTDMTISLWQKVQVKMLPTPAKFHYSFNIRDLSRVFQGILLAPRNTIVDATYLVALWRHEIDRVFCDKLTTHDDKAWVKALIVKVIEVEIGGTHAKAQAVEPGPHFVDFLRDPIEDDDGVVWDEHPKFYERVPSLADLRTRIEGFMTKYNEEHKVGKLDLVMFDDALAHLMRISRVLGMDRLHPIQSNPIRFRSYPM